MVQYFLQLIKPKLKIIFLAVLFLGIFGLAKSSLAADVVVNQNSVRQRIEGMGGNYAFGMSGTIEGQYTLNNLKPAHARVEMKLTEWEPVNDNSDFNNFNWSVFQNVGRTNSNFIQMQNFKSRNIPIAAAVWNVPDWMVSNPGNTSQRVIPADKYDEAIESIAAYLLYARDQYGVEIQYVSFNEADGGYQIIFSSAQMASFIKKAGARFSALGINTKWLAGDTSNAFTLVNYAAPILQDSVAKQYLGPISFHSWNSWSTTTMESIYNFGKQYNIPVWCMELGTDPAAWQNPSIFPTWNYALNLAKMYHIVLRHSGAVVIDYWEYGDDYPLVSTSGEPYFSYYIVKQIADNFTVGTNIVETSSNDSEVLVLAGKIPADRLAVQLINSGSSKSVNISGLSDASYSLTRTSSGEKMKSIGTYAAANGNLTLTLPASSVSILAGSGLIPPPSTGPVLHLKFDDGSGTAALDSSGNNYNGTLNNGPVWTSGKIGGGLSFDGINDYVKVSYFNESKQELTVAFWYLMKESADDWNSLIGRSYEHGNGWRIFQNKNERNLVFSYIGVDGVKRWILETGNKDLNTWHHIAATFSMSTGKAFLYLNGVQIDSSVDVAEIGNGAEDMHIGGRFGDLTFNGVIDDARVYNRSLSSQEIQALYNLVGGNDTTPPAAPTGLTVQ